MKTFIIALISIGVFSMGSFALKTIKTREYEKGKSEGYRAGEKAGAEFIIQRFVDRKLLLVPPPMDNSKFVDCTFVKVEEKGSILTVGGNSEITGCIFAMEGGSYNAIRIPEEAWDTYFGYNTIIGY